MIEGAVYFPVLDGPDPKAWQLWGTRFDQLSTQVDALRPRIKPIFREFYKHEINLLLHPRDKLVARKDDEWGRFIGMVVDGLPPTDGRTLEEKRREIANAFGFILSKVRDAEGALYPRLGFYLLVVVPPEAVADAAAGDVFVSELKESAERVLDREVLAEAVPDPRGFLVMMGFYKQTIFERSIRPPKS